MTNSINKHLRFPTRIHTSQIFNHKLLLIAFMKPNPSQKYIFYDFIPDDITGSLINLNISELFTILSYFALRSLKKKMYFFVINFLSLFLISSLPLKYKEKGQ